MEVIGFQKHRVIIDTDPGIDDALAIFVALAHFQVEGFFLCMISYFKIFQSNQRIIELY